MTPNLPEISPEEVGSTLLLDVREDEEWEAGRAPGALHLPMSSISHRLAEVPAGVPLAVVCRVGARSAQVAGWLRQQGYDAVNVSGGMLAWEHHGLPVDGVIV